MAAFDVELDSDSGDDLDIERNGNIPWSRANRLRALLAKKPPISSAHALTSLPQTSQAPTDFSTLSKQGAPSDLNDNARLRKQWENLKPGALARNGVYINVDTIASQGIADGYIRAAWSPSWQERMNRVDMLPGAVSSEAVRALDYSSSHLARGTVLNGFAARLNEVSPERELRPAQNDGNATGGAVMGGSLWEGELTRHVQRLVEQAEATIGNHAEEIRKAESVLESTLQELTATSAFQEQLLQNKLDFLSKDFEKRAAEIHRQYLCHVEELKAEVLEKADSQNKLCEDAIRKKAADLSAALQGVGLQEQAPVSRISGESETGPLPASSFERQVEEPLQTATGEGAQGEDATANVERTKDSQTPQNDVTPAQADKLPLDDMVWSLKPQRLERALSEVRDWLADTTGAASTPIEASVFSPSSIAAEQGSVNGASLFSPLSAQPQSPSAYSLPASPAQKPRASAQSNGTEQRNGKEQRNWKEQRNGPTRPRSPEAARPLSVQAPEALQLAEKMRRELERGSLISLTSPDGDLVPVKGTRSPFRDSRSSPSIAVPRSNPASPSRPRSPFAASPLWLGSARGAARANRARSDPLETPVRKIATRGGGQRRANSVSFSAGSKGKAGVRVIDLFQSDSESEEEDGEE